MITISCTACKEVLTIDDAFAGGVCRCQHCGAIQTVPSRLKDGGAPTSGAVAQAASGRPPKTLYQNRAKADAGDGTGLDDLADVVASSGLSSGLSGRRESPSVRQQTAAKKKQNMLIFGGAGVIALLLGIILLMALNGGDETPQQSSSGSAGSVITQSGEVIEKPSGPSFVGMPLSGTSFVYVLDRGSSMSDSFGYLIEATIKSIESLGPEAKYQVIFWSDGNSIPTVPAISAYANPGNLETTKRELRDMFAFGQTEPRPALEKAMTEKPSTIIIATSKGWDLDDSFTKMVMDVRRGHPAIIHTLSIGQVGSATGLKQAASRTAGQFREVSRGELEQFAK